MFYHTCPVAAVCRLNEIFLLTGCGSFGRTGPPTQRRILRTLHCDLNFIGPANCHRLPDLPNAYKARDTKLDREVTIKVLPAVLAQDPERLARFEREAKVLASLNHPNIAQIYGIEESSSGRARVTELVPRADPSDFAPASRGAHVRVS
jgi:hypothetical protein